MKITEKVWLRVILLVAVILRFANLTVSDIKNDSALYSVRALGWFDYLGGGQTAPIQWFKTIPGWANLSFHDCPPLVFFIQKLFFLIFGDNTFAVRLPFALAGVITVLIIYYAVKCFRPGRVALWSAGLLSISSYAVWASRAGYLEGVEVLFITLSLWFFIRYLTEGKDKNLYWWALAVGLAFMSKYTSVFLLPVGLICLVAFEYKTLKAQWKKIVYSLLIFLGTISPVVIYNILVLKYRGHLDASLSAMVGLHPQDFSVIASRAVNANIVDNFFALAGCFFNSTSIVLIVACLLALVYLVFKIIRRRAVRAEIFIFINILAAWLMFCFGVPAIRQVSIMVPFFLIILAIALGDLGDYLKDKKFKVLNYILLILLTVVMAAELFYSLNTNLLDNPLGQEPWLRSSQRLESDGWNELEDYWRANLLPSLPQKKKIKRLEDMSLSGTDFSGKNVVFYDDNVNWFAFMWYIEKYPLYYRFPFLPVSYLLSQPQALEQFKQLGAKDFYYVSTHSSRVTDPVTSNNQELMEAIKQFNLKLDEAQAGFSEIKNHGGEETFRVYKLPY